MKKETIQMSEAIPTGILLTLSGGLQDAYTYFGRDGVFANAQTGNIVLLGTHVAAGQWSLALRYALPVVAFAAGVYAAEHIKKHFKETSKTLHWRQIVVAIEIVLLFAVGFLPQSANVAANILVSFVCSMQVNTFRKLKGAPYATTMCIGNLRSGTEQLYAWRQTKDPKILEKCLRYYGVIAIFGFGATLGSLATRGLGARAIWVSCALLVAVFCIMFIHEKEEERNA